MSRRKRRDAESNAVDISFLTSRNIKENFKHPFNLKDGKPKQYLKGIMIFLDGKPRKKEEILIATYGKQAMEDRGISNGQLSSTFASLRHLGILDYDDAIKKWTPGDNYQKYIAYVIQQLFTNVALNKTFMGLFDSWDSNTEFYLKNILMPGGDNGR